MKLMEDWVIEKIARINQEFYQNFAQSFSATRGQVQPGVVRLLKSESGRLNWLDIGCGNGSLPIALLEWGYAGRYLGCDFSHELLDAARARLSALQPGEHLRLEFQEVDVRREDWPNAVSEEYWDVVSMFAVLHHIPSNAQRQQLMRALRKILPAGKRLYLSVWQLQNSPRLLPRIKPWESVEIPHQEVEQGDILMDWRAGLDEKNQWAALRYVHIFDEVELQRLAQNAGFSIADAFYSDGKEGNLALYQTWI